MVLTAISFLLNGGMKFLLCGWVCSVFKVCWPNCGWNSDLALSHKISEGNAPCGAASQEPALCTRLNVSPPMLVAAEVVEYLSRE